MSRISYFAKHKSSSDDANQHLDVEGTPATSLAALHADRPVGQIIHF